MLGNDGWGLREMILLSSIILIALFTATFFVISMYSQLDKGIKMYEQPKNEETEEKEEYEEPVVEEAVDEEPVITSYLQAEKQLKDAAIAFAQELSLADDGYIRVEVSTLLELSYIEPIVDEEDKSLCRGYVEVYPQEDGRYQADAYLMCNNYMTEGYSG